MKMFPVGISHLHSLFKDVSRKDCDIIPWNSAKQGGIYPGLASTGSWAREIAAPSDTT